MKITALTSNCVDVFPEKGKVYVGGNSLNFATQCRLSGIKNISVMGAIGDDDYGKSIQEHLNKSHIDHSHLHQINAPTASNKIFINEEGDRYFKADSWQGGAFDIFRLSENDWKYLEDSTIISMPAGDPNLKELLIRRNNNQLVVIDFLDYFGITDIEKHIENIDIVFLSGKKEMLNDLEKLSVNYGKMIVATLGAEGSIAFYNNHSYVQEAIAVDKVIDTTGCGDAYQAAFSIEWLQTYDIEKAMYAGAMAASKVVAFIGGVQ